MDKFIKSTTVELRIIEGKGRCLFLTVPVKKGDTIFEEDPLISCQFAWNKTYQYLACDLCLRPLENVEENIARLSNNRCVEIAFLEYDPTNRDDYRQCDFCEEKYCSERCRQVAWNQYHQFLCHKNEEIEPLVQLVEHWKKIHYPPETMNIMLLARIIAHIQLSKDKEAVFNTYMQFCHQTVCEDQNLAHILLGEKFKYDIDELWKIFSSVLQSKCDKFNKNLFTDSVLTKEGFLRLLTLIGRNGQGIGTSILASWASTIIDLDVPTEENEKINRMLDEIYNAIEEHVGSFINNEGTGLYVIQSCINHSCVPNAKIKFPYNNNRLALVAKHDMLPGEELLISYLDKCSRKRSCHSRRKILKENYLFTCTCSKCIADSTVEFDVTSEEDEESDDDYSEDIDML